ncbi:TPR domain-containing protein [Apiospora kogelbergensis]|uniref:TPR domain-containing protein n=1 Tax=Apiospora kogelbergensis TaxID=1337665 RepID=A0AAW0QFB3_9PEZI
MAPTRPNKKSKKGDKGAASADDSKVSPLLYVKAAETQLQAGNPSDALELAKKALSQSQTGSDTALAALNLLGQINIEIGEFETARSFFLKAVAIDEDGSRSDETGGGPEKFLCLAQLSEEGGLDSVKWFEKGAAALKAQIQKFDDVKKLSDEQEILVDELRQKHAMTLCAVSEIYMTDLSWEADAEARCEALVTEATMVAPDFAETWQTLASVRISQERFDDAKAALIRSLELWKDLPTGIPPVGLVRLLMEVGMEQEAIEVLERLVGEDDHSVEVWYLGGWGLYVMGEKQKQQDSSEGGEWKSTWISSKTWLTQCLNLFKKQDYEDDRLGEHANELLAAVTKDLGDAPSEDEDDGDDGDEVWEDEDGSDEEMGG